MGKNIHKVCIITDQFPPYPSELMIMRGGIEIGLTQLYDEFIKEGYKVVVISQQYIKELNTTDSEYVKRVRTYVPYSLEKNMLKNGLRFLINETFNPLTFWTVYKILKNEKPEGILLGGTRQLSMAPIIAARLLHIPIYIRYDWICPAYPKQEVCSTWVRIFECGKCIEKYNNLHLGKLSKIGLGVLTAMIFKIKIHLWKQGNAVLPVNEFYSNMYQSLGIPKEIIRVIPTSRVINKVPITTEKFKQIRKHSRFLLLYAGRLSPEKGIMLLLDSFEKVIKQKSDVHLLIAGDGLLRNELLKRIERNPQIIYLGWQTKEQLSELYQISDAVIIPTIVPEGHPRTAEEAMTFKKVIIGSDMGGLHEIFEKYPKSIGVNELNTESFAKAILRCIEGEMNTYGEADENR